MTPQYDSTTRIYVVSQNVEAGAGLTNQELQAGTYLAKDYREIILSQDVLTQVATELNLKESLKEKYQFLFLLILVSFLFLCVMRIQMKRHVLQIAFAPLQCKRLLRSPR